MFYKKVSDKDLEKRDVTAFRFMLEDGSYSRPMALKRRHVGEVFRAKDGGQMDNVPNGLGIQSSRATTMVYKGHQVTDLILDHFQYTTIIKVRYKRLTSEPMSPMERVRLLQEQRNIAQALGDYLNANA